MVDIPGVLFEAALLIAICDGFLDAIILAIVATLSVLAREGLSGEKRGHPAACRRDWCAVLRVAHAARTSSQIQRTRTPANRMVAAHDEA